MMRATEPPRAMRIRGLAHTPGDLALLARRGLGLGAMLLLGACTVGPDFVRPAAPTTARYTAAPTPAATVSADGQAQRLAADTTLPADWWRLFHCAALDAAVRQALDGNPTLEASAASLRLSQDKLQAGYGVFFPQIGAGLDGRRQRSAPLQEGSAAPGSIFNLVTLSGTISYTLDLFGGQRRGVESLRAASEYQRYLHRAAYLSLSANVVNASIARATYAAQMQASGQLVALQQEQLQLIGRAVQSGTTPYSTLLAARAQLAQYQATLAALRQHHEQAGNLLAVLQGQAPADASLPAIALHDLTLPRDLPLGLPSELVRQRPDILAAEAQLHVASAEIGVATAAMLPSLTLSADYGSAATHVGALGAAGGTFWGVGPALSAPLFAGGTLWYQRKAALDAYQQARASYRQTVLSAFEQVADSLKALEQDALALQAYSAALHASDEARALLRANYRAGLVSYAEVLAAELQYHLNSLDYLQAVGQRQQDTVALFAALGGGWWNAPEPAAGEPR